MIDLIVALILIISIILRNSHVYDRKILSNEDVKEIDKKYANYSKETISLGGLVHQNNRITCVKMLILNDTNDFYGTCNYMGQYTIINDAEKFKNIIAELFTYLSKEYKINVVHFSVKINEGYAGKNNKIYIESSELVYDYDIISDNYYWQYTFNDDAAHDITVNDNYIETVSYINIASNFMDYFRLFYRIDNDMPIVTKIYKYKVTTI